MIVKIQCLYSVTGALVTNLVVTVKKKKPTTHSSPLCVILKHRNKQKLSNSFYEADASLFSERAKDSTREENNEIISSMSPNPTVYEYYKNNSL